MQIDHLQKCGHAPCLCEVTASEEFCSDHCRGHAQSDHDTCTCGHTDCAIEPVAVPA